MLDFCFSYISCSKENKEKIWALLSYLFHSFCLIEFSQANSTLKQYRRLISFQIFSFIAGVGKFGFLGVYLKHFQLKYDYEFRQTG